MMYPASINPFDEDIVTEPRRIEAAVPGLNDTALNTLMTAFKRLVQTPPPRINTQLPKAQFVISPEPGYGKSHLIGRLFAGLDGLATRIYIFPFEDAATYWKSVLDRIVYELKAPERNNPQDLIPDEPTQLDAFAHGVIAHLVADLVESDRLPSKQPKSTAIQALRAGKLATYREARGHSQWPRFIRSFVAKRENVQSLALCIESRGVPLVADPSSWLRVLYTYAWSGDAALRRPCLDWLRGNSVDEEDAKRIGLSSSDLPRPDPTNGQLNELSRDRIVDLCRLAGFYRPFVFCFDHTENYGKSAELAWALGQCVDVINRNGLNQMTVFTANQLPWTEALRAHWEDAQKDSLAPALTLEPIKPEQAGQLIKLRCRNLEVEEARIARFLDYGNLLKELFKSRSAMGIRTLLKLCRDRWRDDAPVAPRRTIEGLFRQYLDKLSTQSHRLEFNRDILRWLVDNAAKGLPGIEVHTAEARPGQRVPSWQTSQWQILFDFESGSHWKRWQAIADRAEKYCQQHPNTKIVYLRTPELDPIPGRWPTVGARIESAKRSFLHLLLLERNTLKEIYAGYELYSDAVQGDIDFTPDEVIAFLRDQLAALWDSIRGKPHSGGPAAPRDLERNKGLATAIRELVREARFLSLDELITKLSPPALSREAVLAACGLVPEIAIHPSPTMVVLHWQSR